MTNVRAEFRATPSAHFSIKVPSYARISAPMRELVGCFLHKELWEYFQQRIDSGVTIDDEAVVRDHIVHESLFVRAKAKQKSINGKIFKYALDHFFSKDLEEKTRSSSLERKSSAPAREYFGAILGMEISGAKQTIYVELFEPPVEVKVYVMDLNSKYDVVYVPEESLGKYGTTVRITPKQVKERVWGVGPSFPEGTCGAPILTVGDHVALQVEDYMAYGLTPRRDRWIFSIRALDFVPGA